MEINPIQNIKKIQIKKYQFASIPILIVVAGFLLNSFLNVAVAKYISLFGLMLYVVVIMQFRVTKAVLPKSSGNSVLAPIFGKVTKLEKNTITIQKRFFQPADLRVSFQTEICTFSKGSVSRFEVSSQLGRLVGIAIGKIECRCKIPENFVILVENGENVKAGETVLAETR